MNVGDVIVVITEEGAPGAPKPPAQAKAAEKAPEAGRPEAKAPPAREKKVPVLATPATRMLAKQLGVNIEDVKGTGPGGRITDEDVRNAAVAKPAEVPAKAPAVEPAGPEERIPMRGIRKTIADNLMRSLARTAQVTLVDDADLTKLVELRGRINQELAGTAKVSYLAFMVKAVVTALKAHPMLNASIDDEKGEIVTQEVLQHWHRRRH